MSQRPLRVAVFDYGAGNIVSISQALVAVGAEVVVAAEPAGLSGADVYVVPGVGAARPAMNRLRKRGLEAPLRDWVREGRPTLGICLGYQLFFERSAEGDARTIGLLAGETVELVDAPTLPHIGWNAVEYTRPNSLFEGISDGSHFYFVHSFVPVPADEGIVLARTTHGRPFVSAVASGALVGVQFHPEKSADAGLRFLTNFVAMARLGVAGRGAKGGAASTDVSSGPAVAGEPR